MFAKALRALQVKRVPSRWVWIPYDQLHASFVPEGAGIVFVEMPEKAARRPYHQQKLALVLANGRHFLLEQARRGVPVRHRVGRLADVLRVEARELGGLTAMQPAERETREEIAPLVAKKLLTLEPHRGWLTSREDFLTGAGEAPPWRMDAFYRHVRRSTGILMERGSPGGPRGRGSPGGTRDRGKFAGGRLSHDSENRKRWRGAPLPPRPPSFPRDEIKEEVARLVRDRFGDHPGTVDLDALPATLADAQAQWAFGRDRLLAQFGPFEDAMSAQEQRLFHTRISGVLNLHRLLPREVLRDALGAEVPLQSKEGFVRQILGWREFVRHVHDEWPELSRSPSYLSADLELPQAYWGVPSGLHCLDTVVAQVRREAWSHHITRLMVLGNIATLLGVRPRAITDWFWAFYEDAYDWVVEPNVMAMATFGAGPVMTTKPYVAGAAYIDRMSDYCQGCRFDPKRDCPLTPMYWAFLQRNEEKLRALGRMQQPLYSLGRRTAAQKKHDAQVYEISRDKLGQAGELVPADFATRAKRSAAD